MPNGISEGAKGITIERGMFIATEIYTFSWLRRIGVSTLRESARTTL
jgi:hypothetical protein